VVWAAADADGRTRLRLKQITGGEARAISKEGIQTGVSRPFHLSPDGSWVAALGPEKVIWLFPVDGGEPHRLLGALAGDEPSGWSEDGRSLFVIQQDYLPAHVFRVDLASGARRPWLDLIPEDPAGIGGIFAFVVTPDGKAYAYTYARELDSLFLMTGLR
jgi:hypothetical protein